MEALLQDIRYGLRILFTNKPFTVTVVVIIGLGIGANTAIFSIVDAALLQRLPFDDAEQLVVVNGVADRPSGPQVRGASYPDLVDWRRSNRTFEELAAVSTVALNLTQTDAAERVAGEMVSEGYFAALRAEPARGRVFTRAESGEVDAHPVVIIGDGLWSRRFGGDPAIVGDEIRLNGRPYTVVGVMPAGFRGVSLIADFWLPMSMVSAIRSIDILEARVGRWLFGIGRLALGVGIEQAQEDLDAISGQLAATYPDTNTDRRALVASLRDNYVGNLQLTLAVLLVSVGAVLLIACANVTNLLLARCTTRSSEVALRQALGAGRGRLARQMITESVTLALFGGLAGVLAAMWALEGLTLIIPAGVLPAYAELSLNPRVFAFTATVTLMSGVAFGIAPAFRVGLSDLGARLRAGTRTLAGGGRSRSGIGLQSVLVAGQVALTAALLLCAGLMARSLGQQLAVEPGFSTDGVSVFRLTLPRGEYPHERRAQLADALVQNLEATSGIRRAAVAADVPFRNITSASTLYLEGDGDDEGTRFYRHRISTGYLDVLQIPLLEGRGFDASDRVDGRAVALVGESTARRLWPGKPTAVGEVFRLGDPSGTDVEVVEVVGVVGDVKFRAITDDLMNDANDPEVYFPLAQASSNVLEVLVATNPGATVPIRRLRGAVNDADSNLAVNQVATMASVLDAQMAMRRLQSTLLGAFGVLALLLGSVGLYGLLAYAVARRYRELGIRLALGATPSTIVREVVRQGMTLALVGLAVGIAGGIVAAGAMRSLLYGVERFDPITLVSTIVVLLTTALLASYLPARRAARVNPMRILRSE